MADKSPQVLIVNVGALTNALLPVWKVPAGFGGITILGAQETFLTAGTARNHLIDMGAAGTTTNGGTLATSGGTARSAKVPVAMTLGSTVYLAEGSYLGIKEDNTGANVTVTEIAITYVFGK